MASTPSVECAQSSRLLDVTALGESILVRNDRQRYTGSWYVGEPKEHAGVAAFKAFGREGSPDTYTFELVGFGTDVKNSEAEEDSDLPILSRPSLFRIGA